ncbi:unnamed protein product [Dovyalis caffra]|uniref:Cystinosin homolog n=1 Tax=Dovyalis caffra TaxID=77055 RepID=A0AAV1R2S4_9ROSI|nr:unnamed protein product [Dovyalis caffra]
MASWNSIPLEIAYQTFGWIAFFSWSISFYPQVILNFRRKSVVGLNFDFVLLNLTKHSSYLIYNASLYFSSAIQHQYFEKYGFGEMIPVAANDVAFSIHAVLLTAITLFQIVIYDPDVIILPFEQRGNQKVSKISIAIVCAVWLAAADHMPEMVVMDLTLQDTEVLIPQPYDNYVLCFWFAVIDGMWSLAFGFQAVISTYLQQGCAHIYHCYLGKKVKGGVEIIISDGKAIMNFMLKSTDGFSIGNILLDFLGGVTNYAQMAVQSIDQNSWVNFYGNIGKTLLSLVSIFFDLLFMCQHYILYPAKKAVSQKLNKEGTEPLIKNSEEPSGSEDV